MVASYDKIVPSSLKMLLKRLRFWDNSRLLTTYGCPEFMFVSEGGTGVRTVTLDFAELAEETTRQNYQLLSRALKSASASASPTQFKTSTCQVGSTQPVASVGRNVKTQQSNGGAGGDCPT